MNSELFSGLQMNAPPLDQVPRTSTPTKGKAIGAENEVVKTAPSFQSVLAEQHNRSGETQAQDQSGESVIEEEISEPVTAQAPGSSEIAAVETLSPLSVLLPLLFQPDQTNLPGKLPGEVGGEAGEHVTQDLSVITPGAGINWAALNLPGTGKSQPLPTEAGTGIAANLPLNTGPLGTEPPRDSGVSVQAPLRLKASQGLPAEGLQSEETSQPQMTKSADLSPIPLEMGTSRSVSFGALVERALSLARTASGTALSHPVHQVVRAMDLMVRLDQSNLNLQLYPESLGRIEIRIAHGAEGTRVWMVADHPQTERLLQAGLNDLRQSLTQSGIQLADVAVGQQNAQEHLFRQSHGSPVRFHLPLETLLPGDSPQEVVSLKVWRGDSYVVDYRI